ncbi:hypothetical protein [Flavobacterium beibuense]|uniref:hypothetical protein n=1 Tax=Flavobacterium beibuense TaxID=657326 RepID=UPI003A927315
MKYFVLVCFLLIMSCKLGKDASTLDSVIGIASNQKSGAILSTDIGTCSIVGLSKWDSIYVGKRVKVKGDFLFIDAETDRLKIEDSIVKQLQAQTYPKYYSVTNAIWELYNSD